VAGAVAWAVAGLVGSDFSHPETGPVRRQPGNRGPVWGLLFWGLLGPAYVLSELTAVAPGIWIIRPLAGGVAGGVTGWLWRRTGVLPVSISRAPETRIPPSGAGGGVRQRQVADPGGRGEGLLPAGPG
jgi:hypothetical protein